MIAETTPLPVALPFWGGFRRILAVTGGRNANEFAVSSLFGGACLGLQNLHPRFKSGRRLQSFLGKTHIRCRGDDPDRPTVTVIVTVATKNQFLAAASGALRPTHGLHRDETSRR